MENTVYVSGSEWPKTRWDTPGAWYKGTVLRTEKNIVFVKFDGEDEEYDFTREILDTYQNAHDTFRFQLIYKAAELVFGDYM